MPPIIATIIFSVGILGLFYLDRHDGERVSHALWIPALWLFINTSRSVSMWFHIQGTFYAGADATEAYVEGSPVDRAFFTVLMVAAVAVLFKRANRVGPILRKNALLLTYLTFCLFSLVWSDFPVVGFKRWTKTAFGDIPMMLLVLTDPHPLNALKRMLTRLGFLLFPLSILFIMYYPRLGRRLTNSWTMEPVGVATQKNSLGLDCLIFGVFFLWIVLSVYQDREDSSRRRRLLAYGTIIAMIAWLLRACNSTTSIVGLACASVVVWFAGRSGRRPIWVHLLVVAVLGLATTALFFNPGGDMVEALGKSKTFSGRTEIWSAVLSLHTNPLIGTGFESFWLGSRLDFMTHIFPNNPVNEAHNGYLELYLNLGWCGICFLAAMLLVAYTRVIFRRRQNPRLAALLLGFLLCTLFNAFSENAFRVMTPSWIFLILVLLATSQAQLFESGAPIGPAQANTFADTNRLGNDNDLAKSRYTLSC